MQMKRIAVITARGGSKRIPRKNIKLFLGKPILHYSIEAALASGIFDEVMVSTEDAEIAEIARQAGAAVPFYRTERTSGDFATTADVIAEVIEEYAKRGQQFDELCCIYPTAPFITAQKLKEAMELLTEKGCDGVLPVVRFSFPPQRCVVIKDSMLQPKWQEYMNARSQDLEPYYHDCGQFYCISIKAFEKQHTMVMQNMVPYVMSELDVQDIDTEEDWQIAEMKYRLRMQDRQDADIPTDKMTANRQTAADCSALDGQTESIYAEAPAPVCRIKNRLIGDGHPAYIIAEMSANHAGSIERAKEIIRAARESGADCIKIQTYTQDTLTIDCDNEYFNITDGTWKGENLYSLYGKAYTPWEWQAELKAEADRIGIDFFSTPFDNSAVDFLEGIGVEFYKIASFEMVDIPLIEYVASKGKPIIMSTGMATREEIEEAVAAVKRQGNENLILLKCSSAYPAISADMHLKTIQHMKAQFGVPVGLSDHSMGSLGAATAVALGAAVIEKHFCMSREIDNPDASFSMTPEEFKQMVEDIRNVEKAVGGVSYGVSEQEKGSMGFRRSLFVVEDMKAGDVITEQNVRSIRPAYGMKPKYYPYVLGKKVCTDMKRGTPLQMEHIADLRPACADDEALLLTWKNDETARKFALSPKVVSGQEHAAWFYKMLQSSDTCLYIMQSGSTPVGQLRLDADGADARISYSVAKEQRGFGYGELLLLLAEEKAKENTAVTRLMGEVHRENEASKRCFRKLGYTERPNMEHPDFLTFIKRIR